MSVTVSIKTDVDYKTHKDLRVLPHTLRMRLEKKSLHTIVWIVIHARILVMDAGLLCFPQSDSIYDSSVGQAPLKCCCTWFG